MNNQNSEIEKYSNDGLNTSSEIFTLKILFGPMYGCDLELPAEDYFIFIHSSNILAEDSVIHQMQSKHAVYFSKKTLYIPSEISASNMILKLSNYKSNDDSDFFELDIIDRDLSIKTLSVEYNSVFEYEHVKFALKKSHVDWSKNIKNHPTTHNITSDSIQIEHEIKPSFLKNKFIILILFISIIITLTLFIKSTNQDNEKIVLQDIFSESQEQTTILTGHDNYIYVLVDSFRSLEWANEAISKLKNNEKIIIYPIFKQNKSIIKELHRAGFPALQIDFSNPQNPVISLYKELSEYDATQLNSMIFKIIPFVKKVNIVTRTSNELIKDAKNGLERLHIPFRQINSIPGQSFIISDALSDSALNSLKHFINDFQHQWGSDFITFSINLDENWLQNKSYVDSRDGYLFLNPRHWYFPLKNKDF